MTDHGRSREVVLVGGGHAHVLVLEHLIANPLPDCRLTILTDKPVSLYSGMVPGFVAGQYRAGELQIDVEALARRVGARLIVARAVKIEAASRRIVVDDGPPVPYDLASLDIGSTVSGLDLPGVREHALAVRPIDAFVRRVGRFVETVREREAGDPLRVVVVGGGAGGVELAFALLERLEAEAVSRVEVSILEGGPRILSGHSGSLVRRVERQARARGLQLLCARRVVAAEAGAVTLDGGERVSFDVLVWVAGAVCQPIFRDSGLSTDGRGFVLVRSTLQVERHDDLFATGDCGTLIEHPRTPKAGVYAVRQGPFLTHNLRAALTGGELRRYTPQSDFLTLLNLGDGSALGAKWGWSFGGRWVMRLKDRIDRGFMRRFRLPADEA